MNTKTPTSVRSITILRVRAACSASAASFETACSISGSSRSVLPTSSALDSKAAASTSRPAANMALAVSTADSVSLDIRGQGDQRLVLGLYGAVPIRPLDLKAFPLDFAAEGEDHLIDAVSEIPKVGRPGTSVAPDTVVFVEQAMDLCREFQVALDLLVLDVFAPNLGPKPVHAVEQSAGPEHADTEHAGQQRPNANGDRIHEIAP